MGRTVLAKVVEVHVPDAVSRLHRHADSVVDHERCELLAVHEDDPRIRRVPVFKRLAAEVGRCDEDALRRALPVEGTDELLNLRPPHGVRPALGLDVD